MTTKHTPGPWVIENKHQLQNETVYVTAGSTAVARVYLPDTGTNGAYANARLIAAAPDLLRALQNLLTDAIALDLQDSQFAGVLIEARAAIAKATGE